MNNTTNIALNRILNVNIEDITKSFIEDMFASYHDKQTNEFKQANFDPTDKIVLTNNEYEWVDKKVDTTIGMLLFNRYVLERTGIIQHLRYWNRPLNSKGLSALDVAVNNLVITDKITTKDLGNYIDSRDRLGFWCASFLAVSISAGLIRPMDNVNKRKMELFKENEEALTSDNSVQQILAVNKIEKELMGMVRDNLKDDTGYDMYASGDGNLDNNYKTINVMRGAVYNNITKKYDIVSNSLMNGVTKKDIPAFANSVVAGTYPSAVGTAEAGYMSKIIIALLQSEHINPDPDSDCGTTSTIPLSITNDNKQYILYRYIDNNGKKELTTLDNIDSFVGKTVNLYTPQGCRQNAICGKCAGRVFHNLGVTQVGLLTTQITQKLLNIKLKSKHDLSQSATIIPEDFVFLHKNDYCYIDNGILKNKITMRFFIPRLLDDENVSGFVREPSTVTCMGIFPVKFYDNNDKEILSTMMTIPAMLVFHIYEDIQEDADDFIVTYEPGSNICDMGIQQNVLNVERFINQIYLWSKIPQIPYNLMTEMMFRCLAINHIDLTGPSITYELLARRVCRSGNDTFAKVYGKNKNVDQMSYTKEGFREAVHNAGALQAVLFQDTSKGMNVGLAQTLNGVEPVDTPLDHIIRA
jgi:hypothetical protein